MFRKGKGCLWSPRCQQSIKVALKQSKSREDSKIQTTSRAIKSRRSQASTNMKNLDCEFDQLTQITKEAV